MRELQAGSDARVSLQQELAALQVDFERQLTAGIEARTRHLAEEVQHMTAARDNAVEVPTSSFLYVMYTATT